jgi:hypothetical protein
MPERRRCPREDPGCNPGIVAVTIVTVAVSVIAVPQRDRQEEDAPHEGAEQPGQYHAIQGAKVIDVVVAVVAVAIIIVVVVVVFFVQVACPAVRLCWHQQGKLFVTVAARCPALGGPSRTMRACCGTTATIPYPPLSPRCSRPHPTCNRDASCDARTPREAWGGGLSSLPWCSSSGTSFS